VLYCSRLIEHASAAMCGSVPHALRHGRGHMHMQDEGNEARKKIIYICNGVIPCRLGAFHIRQTISASVNWMQS
jgi:hypothetical protein